MFSKIAAVFVAGLAVVNAYTQPTTGPLGNPIYTPNSGDVVPAGAPYQITWGPTTSGTVTIVLLKGPSTNVLPLYPIVEKLANTGSFSWTPATDLTAQNTGYGLQIIDDATGQYQYSTQFGISNSNSNGGGSTTTTGSGNPTSYTSGTMTMSAPTSYTAPANTTSTVSVSTLPPTNATMTTMTAAASSTVGNTPLSMTGAATAPAASQTNAAGQLAASFGGVVAIFAAVAAF